MNDQGSLSLQEIQRIEFDILCKVVDYLDKNKLRYILCGGTLLGAIRHNGFIPWDDDVDILIPRDDYEKLKSLVSKDDNIIEGMYVELPGNNDNFYPFIKVVNCDYYCVDERFISNCPIHIWVDVFPLDHFPDDEASHRKVVNRLLFLQNLLYTGILTKDYWMKAYKYKRIKMIRYYLKLNIYKLLGEYSGISKKIDKYASSMNKKYNRSNHVGDGAWPEGMKDYFLLSDTTPTISHVFEDREFSIPANYDSYLRTFYGDYMTPPSKEKRAGHHITVYRADHK